MSMTAGTQTDLTRSGRRQKKNYGILQCVMAYCKGASYHAVRAEFGHFNHLSQSNGCTRRAHLGHYGAMRRARE